MVQLSHPYKTTGKTIALTIHAFVVKVMSLLFNMLSRLVISFSSKEQLSFNFMAAVTTCSDFGVPQNKASHCFHCFPIYLPLTEGTRCHDLSFLIIREMQIKTTMRHHLIPIKTAIIKKSTKNKCWRAWRKGNPLILLAGM